MSGAGSKRLARNVDDVLITAELATRPSRSPDFQSENRALALLAREMASSPSGVLRLCAELVMELCHADSAGISILEPGGRSGILRWHAAAGEFAPNLDGTMAREASPCGTVMERDCVLLFKEAERVFPALKGVEPSIYENLLAPWHVKGEPVGTIWAIKHTREGQFDAEDARVLQSLAGFAAAAFQMTTALNEASIERDQLRQSTEALRETEARLHAAVELVGLSPYNWDPLTGALNWDDRLRAMWGLPPGAYVDENVFLSGIHPDDRTRVEAAIAHCSNPAGDGLYAVEYRVIGIGDRVERWVSTYGQTTFKDGQPVGFTGAVLDITTSKHAEAALREGGERLKVLVGELQHRTRNLMGVVRSMADRAARSSADLHEFGERFRQQLGALSRVQGLLSRLDEHDRVSFDELIETELSAIGVDTDRVALNGPRGVRLRSSIVQTLAMALHELSTNAIKYGALSQSGAQLAVTWYLVDDEDGRPWLYIDWRESGVAMPPVGSTASGGGQGRELIEKALPYQLNAKTHYELGSEGVHCVISLPLSSTFQH